MSPAEVKRKSKRKTARKISGKYDINMSDAEFQKLSRGQKSLVTRMRREARDEVKPAVNISQKPPDIVVDGKETVNVDEGPNSVFLNGNKVGVGVAQP
jgi:hypothetical protein